MRIFQIILAVITLLMVIGTFGMSLYINSNFSKGGAIPQCFMPLNIISAVLVLIIVITIIIKK